MFNNKNKIIAQQLADLLDKEDTMCDDEFVLKLIDLKNKLNKDLNSVIINEVKSENLLNSAKSILKLY